MNLLNKPFSENGNYLCTWDLQEINAHKLGTKGKSGTVKQRNVLTDQNLFF